MSHIVSMIILKILKSKELFSTQITDLSIFCKKQFFFLIVNSNFSYWAAEQPNNWKNKQDCISMGTKIFLEKNFSRLKIFRLAPRRVPGIFASVERWWMQRIFAICLRKYFFCLVSQCPLRQIWRKRCRWGQIDLKTWPTFLVVLRKVISVREARIIHKVCLKLNN